MTNVSKKPLPTEQLDALFHQLGCSLGVLKPKQVDFFLSELLGTEERIMIAKRLAVIVMLIQGHSLYRTATTLKLSTSTVDSIRKKLETNEYTFIVQIFKKEKKNFVAILEVLENILSVGGIMPGRVGLDRYKGLR
jgi:uncharacterized protein YerC